MLVVTWFEVPRLVWTLTVTDSYHAIDDIPELWLYSFEWVFAGVRV
jgi:hypothetical protein